MLKLGLPRLALGDQLAPTDEWWEPGILHDLDDENERFYVNGQTYPSLSAAAVAMGGTNSGQALSIGPHLTGNVLYESDFSVDTDGFVETVAPVALSVAGGNLVATASSGNPRAGNSVPASRKAALISATRISSTQGQVNLAGGNNAALFSASSPSIVFPNGTSGLVASTEIGTLYFGMNFGGTAGVTTTTNWRVEEVLPYLGAYQTEVAFEIDFTTPDSFAAQQVLAEWGNSGASAPRIDVLIDTSGHLRVIVVTSNATQANLDLDELEPETRYVVRGTCKDNAFYANVNGAPLVSDLGGIAPSTGLFWRGRSFGGQTFTGTINRSKVWERAVSDPNQFVSPSRAMLIAGDSIADGAGATTKWYQGLGDPVRAYREIANGGATAAEMLESVLAITGFYRKWPLIMMDFPNSEDSAETCLASYKAAGQSWDHDDWFVMPPAQNVNQDPSAKVTAIQEGLLSDPFFEGHTLDEAEQAAYFAEVADPDTRADDVHFNDAGQAIQRTYVAANRGW